MSKKALELKPVDPKLLVAVDRIVGPISGREFFAALYRSLSIRWKLRKSVLPENPPYKEITDYECGGCGCMVNLNVHGGCPRCFSQNLFYIGHDAVLPSTERPKSNIWAKRHDRASQVARY
jgi:hypothetical protein